MARFNNPDPTGGPKRRAQHLRRRDRRVRSLARQGLRDTRTPRQQLAVLDARLGTDQDDDGYGAARERARLTAAL